MRFTKRKLAAAFALAAAVAAPNAFATNGMNMQGYGPIAYGMGGASMAYDNGVAAVMNNPATLGFMATGSRLDAALGFLGPNVDATCESAPCTGASSDSDATAYYMPAIGYARRDGNITYGIGVFAQGGMGTEYSASSFLAAGSGDNVGAQLGVGRLLIPLAFNVTPDFVIGGTIDYVWANLDLKMAVNTGTAASLITGCSSTADPGCAGLFGGLGTPGAFNWVRIDFSDGDFTDFTGEATATGFAGKIGFAWRVSPEFSFGMAYHTKTSLDDMETSSGALSAGGGAAPALSGSGTIKVRDFQWPATLAAGIAWNATKEIMVAADIKQIYWKDVMKDFKMTFDGTVGGAPYTIDFALPQEWKDQTVYQLGAAWRVTEPLTLRAGVNMASSQIPSDYVNPLFPAIMEEHYTLGLGYAFSNSSEFNIGLAYAPQNCQTSPATPSGSPSVTSCTGGQSAQLMYSAKF